MGDKSTGAAKGADNNKRLALLEAGVSALAMALAANGTPVPEGADVHEIAIAALKQRVKDHVETLEHVKAAGARIEQLERNIAELEEKLTAPGETAEGNGEEISTLKARVAELEAEVEELNNDVNDAISERNQLRNALSEAGQGSAAAVEEKAPAAAPAPIEIVRAENARDVGPTFGKLTPDEIGEAVAGGAQFEIAFSNGEFELVEFGPITVAAGDLHRFATQQWTVAPTIHIKGAAVPMEIHGAGLLLEGVQIGYCTFDPAIRVEPGQERAFNRALIF